MVAVSDVNRRPLDRGVAREPGAYEPAVPWPPVFGVARRVHAGKSAARPDVSFEGGLLAWCENIPVRIEEHHALVARQTGIGEPRAVLAAVDSESVLGAERRDGGDALRDRVVTKAGRFGEDEHGKPGFGALRPKAAEQAGENGAERYQQRGARGRPQPMPAPRVSVDRARPRTYFAAG